MKFLMFLLLLGCAGCSNPPSTFEQSAMDYAKAQLDKHQAGSWRVGGTLHLASALNWQQASYQNKRATCSDFINVLYQQKLLTFSSLKPHKIKTMSETVTTILNEKLAVSGNASQNEDRYKHKRLSEQLTQVIKEVGWMHSDAVVM